MKLSPKQIIFIAVSKYLLPEQIALLKDKISTNSKLSDLNFIRLLEKSFDFKFFRDKPLIQEDIWLYNYLMYENKKVDNSRTFEIGEVINFKGKLLKKGLIAQYERQIILPQLLALQKANKIINNLL